MYAHFFPLQPMGRCRLIHGTVKRRQTTIQATWHPEEKYKTKKSTKYYITNQGPDTNPPKTTEAMNTLSFLSLLVLPPIINHDILWSSDTLYKNQLIIIEPWHEISNTVVCATSKGSDQPAHARSLTRAFASRLSILWLLSYWRTAFGVSKLNMKLHRLFWVYSCQNATLLEITCRGSILRTSSHSFSIVDT